MPHAPPTPAADDPEDVVLALHTASALWARGDTEEALRWVRRAAASAGENGMDARAASLASAAADMTTELHVPASLPSADLAGAAGFGPASSAAAVKSSVRLLEGGAGLMDADEVVDKTVVDQAPVLPADPGGVAGFGCRAFRVAVQGTANGRSVTVRLLGDQERAGAGATEALLVTLPADLNLVRS